MTLFYRYTLIFCLICAPLVRADFGDQSYGWSSVESEDFRDYAVRSLNRQGQLVNDYWVSFWLQQTFLSLNLSSERPVGPTLVLPISEGSINAFAMPGNIIGIHAGLWLAAENDAELTSVIAHEMAHIGLDHFTRLSQASNRQTLTLASGILLSILLSKENPEAANATLISSFAMSSQERLTFSRAMETEADQQAQQMLINAGLNPEAGRSFFRRLDASSPQSGQLEFLRTHPLGETRASDLGGRAYDARQEFVEDPVFELLTARLQQDTGRSNTSAAQQRLMARMTPDEIAADPNLRFMQALLAYNRDSSTEAFQESLTQTIRLFPGFLPAQIKIIELSLGDPTTASCRRFTDTVKRLEDQYVSLDALQILHTAANECQHPSQDRLYAQWLWQSGREESALQFLKSQLNSSETTNQSALLNTLLERYTGRYARFN